MTEPQQATPWSEAEKDQTRQLLFASLSVEMAQALELIQINREYLRLHLAQNQQQYSPQRVGEALDGIGVAAARISRLTENGMELLACMQGQVSPKLAAVDVAGLLQELCGQAEAIHRLLGVELRLQLPENPCCILTDPALAERVLLNLLSNALRASAPGQTVTLALRQSEVGGELTVQDEGCGVDAAFAAQAFAAPAAGEPAPSQARFAGGAGLGLRLCGAYCRLLGWTPKMQPRRRGVRVSIAIPAAQLAPQARLVFRSSPQQRAAALRRELCCVPGLEALLLCL